jgi:hypothetical protein
MPSDPFGDVGGGMGTHQAILSGAERRGRALWVIKMTFIFACHYAYMQDRIVQGLIVWDQMVQEQIVRTYTYFSEAINIGNF